MNVQRKEKSDGIDRSIDRGRAEAPFPAGANFGGVTAADRFRGERERIERTVSRRPSVSGVAGRWCFDSAHAIESSATRESALAAASVCQPDRCESN